MTSQLKNLVQLQNLNRALVVVALVVAVLLPSLTGPSEQLLLTQTLIFAAFGLSLFLLLGDGGLVSFGHAAFLGIGAYTVGILTVKWELPLTLAWLLAPVAGAILSLVVGWFSVRLTALYFAMLTLAFGQFLWAITLRVDFFGGEAGLIGVPTGWIGFDPAKFYYAALVVMLIVLVAVVVVRSSPFGLTLRSTRENPLRAEFSGLNVSTVRLIGFVVAGALAGLAGAMLAVSNGAVSPEVAYFTQSEVALIMVLLGGLRSVWGPIVGAILFTFGEHYIARSFDAWETVVGIAIILVVLFVPGGVTGTIGAAVDRLRERWGGPPAGPASATERTVDSDAHHD
jgi:branched-chain amino acid transport system permease protein